MVYAPDKNFSPSFFSGKDHLAVSNIFYTIQGEGLFAGYPAVFVRLAGCNRGSKDSASGGCEFCDADFQVSTARWLTCKQILDFAKELRAHITGKSHDDSPREPLLVITGGEPFLQELVYTLIDEAMHQGFVVQVESNGDYGDFPDEKDYYVVISPKATVKGYAQLSDELALRFLKADAIKFLISADENSPYYNLPSYVDELVTPVFLSPMAVYARPLDTDEVANIWDHSLIDAEKTRQNYSRAAKLALERGFVVSTQQHLTLAIQ